VHAVVELDRRLALRSRSIALLRTMLMSQVIGAAMPGL